MLYRAVGRVLLVVPAPQTGAAPVMPALSEIRDRRRKGRPADRASRPRPEARPVRRHRPADTVGCPELAAAMRPRPGIDTNVWEHDRAALHELYLLGPRREFGTAGLRRLLAFLQEQRQCN